MRRIGWTALIILLLSLGSATSGAAQLGGLIKKKAEEAAKAAQGAKGAVARKDSARATLPAPASPAAGVPAADVPPAPPGRSDPKIWDNYDFVPGSKILFFTDFADDKVGNFARGLKYVSGPLDVVERDGVKVLRATGRATFLVPVGTRLPERFTLEIDVLAPSDIHELLTFEGGADIDRGTQSASVVWMPSVAWIAGGGQNSPASRSMIPDAMKPQLINSVAHLRTLMDGEYFKMYVNERRLYNIPVLPFRRDSVIRVMLNGSEADNGAVFITSIRVAESETDVLYDALTAKGRWVTQGILFATGKADLQPESRPVLKEIASTMTKYTNLKILIEGHTDNVGSAASNLALSDARAAAVKAALVADFGISDDRISAKGFGNTNPAAPNTTAVGRAQNRRVEIVKQ